MERRTEQILKRLAFNPSTDGAYLTFAGEVTREELRGLDLTNVTSIKHGASGTEVHFADRIKAIELYEQLKSADRAIQDGPDLYTILEQSAKALSDQ